MEMNQLRYFLAVAQCGNFTRAAEQCHVSQPSLSQQIAKLERHLGQPLFHRLGRRVVLTDAGQLLMEKATGVLASLDDAERELREGGSGRQSRLAIGAIPTIAPYLLPQVLKQFRESHPDTELMFHEDVTQRLLEATTTGELDLAIVALPISDERLQIEPLLTEPLLLSLPHGHALAGCDSICLDDLRDEHLIILNEMHCLSEQVLGFFRAYGYLPKVGCRSSQISTIQLLIAAGQGISLLPAMARDDELPGSKSQVVSHFLSDSHLMRTVAVVWHRQRYHGAAEHRFLQEIRAVAATMEANFHRLYPYPPENSNVRF